MLTKRKHKAPKKSSSRQQNRHINNQSGIPENVGYPDLSKANTRIVVIASFICVLLILLLSILFPARETDTEQSTTEATTENEIISGRDPATGFSVIDNETYYYPDDINYYSGWYMVNDDIYYFDEDGTMVSGWYNLEDRQYYFNADGTLASNQWIEDRYVGEDGYLLKDTITPDGSYVDINGIRDDTVSLETSREGLTDLRDELQAMLDGYSGSWSVYVKDIPSNEYMVINNTQYYSASLIKLFCAACAYDLIDKGDLEETENIDRLMQEMISVSDNDAFNLMVMNCAPDHYHVTGRSVIQEYIDANHYNDTTITSILVPTRYKAPSSAGRNYTSVIDCGLLLERIYKGQCVSPEASQKFLDLLLQQSHVNKIPAGLPEGTRCANKTGDTDEVQHDAAIVYSPNGVYILCIMSTGCGSSITNIQSLSTTVYEYFNPDAQLEIYEFPTQ
ncbi:MAG: serine hydrolase [Clostridium sp.]|nr:serine hydrolase [Clostridium sp.]